MNQSLLGRWSTACLAALAIAGCGGGGGSAPATPTAGSVAASLTAAAAVPSNDASNMAAPSAAFMVMQSAGVPAVTVNSPPVVNFAVFSDGKPVAGLTTANTRFAIAKLVPGTNGDTDQWVSYVSKVVKSVAGNGPGGTPVLASAPQATTDTAAATQLVYNADGYYTYTFSTDIKSVAGIAYEPARTHRVAIQLSYKNAAGATVLVNPYFDFTIGADGKSIPVTDPTKTRKMTDVTSCNSCHEKLALHGGGRVDTQYCVMCHNPGTVDPESGNTLTLSTMVHKIHAGKRIKAEAGEDYTIWGYGNSKNSYAEVGFPQDLRNCSKCHTASNPNTPQGDNWKTQASKGACLTCHTDKAGGAWETSHKVLPVANGNASSLTNAQCRNCHTVGDYAPETVHFNQVETNAAKYKMNIESVTYVAGDNVAKKGTVTVKYFLSDPTNGNVAYNLVTSDCTGTTVPTCSSSTKFGNLRLLVGYQNMVGQNAAVTEYSSYNNGGNGANAYAYQGTNDGSNHYSVSITIPKDTATAVAAGTARVITYGQVKEAQLELMSSSVPRAAATPAALVSVLVQNTFKEFAISGALNPRREIVSNDKCNACHGGLGATSGSNELANAFHGGARTTVESCVICHDPNRASSGNMMTNGLPLYESYQMKRMIHGIHGNSYRVSPFTHGNKVAGSYCNPANNSTGTAANQKLSAATCSNPSTPVLAAAVENYGAEVAYPGVGLNCNACHVNNSYQTDLGTLGTVAMKPASAASAAVLETDPNKWLVISPKAASCTGCHDGVLNKDANVTVVGHVASGLAGGAFGTVTQAAFAKAAGENCESCHGPASTVAPLNVAHSLK